MKILIVEDEIKLAHSIMKSLKEDGYIVDHVENGEVAERRILTEPDAYDILLLDLMIPGKDGLSLCKSLREKEINIPILMLTAKDTKQDIMNGLNIGADDYLIKPFSFGELVARINALLRRPRNMPKEELKSKNLILDTASKKVLLDGKEIKLTSKEYNILEFLIRNKGKVVTREKILSHAWDFAFDSFSNIVNVHIKNLRKKINKHDELLETVRGMGYRLKE